MKLSRLVSVLSRQRLQRDQAAEFLKAYCAAHQQPEQPSFLSQELIYLVEQDEARWN
jgi:hypothetical protein